MSRRRGVRARFHAATGAGGLGEDRARDWVVFRMLVNALWRLQDPPGTGRRLPTPDFLTRCVTIAKSVQD